MIPILLTLLAAKSSALIAQDRVIDQGILIVSRGSEVIGREEFAVRRGRTSGGRGGLTIAATAYYPARSPRVRLVPTIELDSDSLPTAAQYDVFDPTLRRMFARLGRRRVTVRTVAPTGESAREYPGAARLWVVDDSVFSLYAVPPQLREGTVTALALRHGVRSDLVLTNRGTEWVSFNGSSVELTHLVLGSGSAARHIWYDPQGRLMKVEIPSANLLAVRETPLPPD